MFIARAFNGLDNWLFTLPSPDVYCRASTHDWWTLSLTYATGGTSAWSQRTLTRSLVSSYASVARLPLLALWNGVLR
tara:strand:+ start:214 stop:444 length:231 start_codon:yes stop_codon:yes gene_type:complete